MPTNKKKKSQKKSKSSTSKLHIMKGLGSYKRPRAIKRMKGKGGYAEDIGSSIGSWLGKKAGGLFSSITGLGTYSVTKNSLLASPSDPPVLSNTKGGTRIQHREYIQDVTGSVGFSLNSFSINPGVPSTFPWLSGCAQNFEEYILHGLVFEFKSTSATALNSTNTALGTVIMATEYNVTNPVFTAKRDMENYVYSTSCSPDVSSLHPVECARDINVLSELFVRSTAITSGTDLRFSDIGLFQIATVGMQASATIGELWVTYDIELIKPKLTNAYTSIGPAHYLYDASSGTPPFGVAPTSTNLFGVNGSQLVLKGSGNTPVTLNVNTLTFTSPGRYLVGMYILGQAATVAYPTITSSTTAVNIPFWNINGVFQFNRYSPAFGLTSSVSDAWYAYDVSSSLATTPATVTFAGGSYPTTITTMHLMIIPLPGGFTVRQLSDMERLQQTVDDLKTRLLRIRVDSCPNSDEEEDEKAILIPRKELTESTILGAVSSLLSRSTNRNQNTPEYSPIMSKSHKDLP